MLAIGIDGILLLASMIFAPKIYGTLPAMRGAKRCLSSRFHTGAPRASQVPSIFTLNGFAYRTRDPEILATEINKRNTSTIFFVCDEVAALLEASPQPASHHVQTQFSSLVSMWIFM
jgi:hypothetical protein